MDLSYSIIGLMIVMIVGLAKQYAVRGTLEKALRALFTNDPFERITNSTALSVKALIIAIEKKDSYTVGHTFRVTMYALKTSRSTSSQTRKTKGAGSGGISS